MFGYRISNIINRIQSLIDIGFSEENVHKIILRNPRVFSNSSEKINSEINFMYDYGFTHDEVIHIFSTSPTLIGYSGDKLNQKISNIIALGLKKEEVKKMICVYPQILTHSEDYIRNRFKEMQNLGFTYQDVINMSKGLPIIISDGFDSIKKRIEFYDAIGIHDAIASKGLNLKQSVELSYARYKFYESRGIIITKANAHKLFADQIAFFKKFGVTKETLLDRYKYDEEIEKFLLTKKLENLTEKYNSLCKNNKKLNENEKTELKELMKNLLLVKRQIKDYKEKKNLSDEETKNIR